MARILHLIHTPRHSGAEILVRDLCLLHQQDGIKCAVAAFSPPQTEFLNDAKQMEQAGTQLYFPQSVSSKWQRIKHFRYAYADFRPDVVFAHSVLPSFYGRLALPLLSSSKPKFVTVLHAASTNDYNGAYFRVLEHLSRCLVDRVISVSKEGAQNYNRHFGQRVPVDVIINGIDIDRFRHPEHIEAREKLSIPGNVKVILQVGRISRVKRQDLSIKALANLPAAINAELWLAGLTQEEDYQHSLHELVRQKGLEGRVKFLGSRSDIPELLAAADLYLMPSMAEAHSIALLEALASNVPAIVSDIPAFSAYRDWPGVEIIPTDEIDNLVTFIEKLLDSERCQRDMDDFSIKVTADKYKKLLKKYT